MKGIVHDNLNLCQNPKVARMLEQESKEDSETILYSGRVVKVSSTGNWQLRALMITTRAVYNILPSNLGRCKRRIAISKVSNITISKISTEMVLHVPSEYDLRFQSFYKDEILFAMKAAVKEDRNADLRIKYVWDFFLGNVTRTKFDAPVENVPDAADEDITKEGKFDLETKPEDDTTADRCKRLLKKKQLAGEGAVISDDEESGENQIQIDLKRNFGRPQRINIDSFDLLAVLGRGAFGKVIQVRKKDNGKIYAMKVLKKHYVYAKKQVVHTNTERAILEACQHPFLMGLKYAFQSKTKLYLIMNFFQGGELFFHIQKQKRFNEQEAVFIAAEVALAIGHLHKLDFIYRDLKPENILMDEHGHICLTDFGLSKQLDANNPVAKTMCGTPEYLPPEVLLGKEHGKPIDWWSFGVLMYELAVGIPPFMARNHRDLYRKIQYAPIKFPRYVSQDYKTAVLSLLSREVETRLGTQFDVEEIKKLKVFRKIDWDKLYHKQIKPVYKPVFRNATKENFASEFADEPPIDSVVPESLMRTLPLEDADFTAWTFVGSQDGKVASVEPAEREVLSRLPDCIEESDEDGSLFEDE